MPDIRAESAATAEAAREKEDCAGPRITGIEKIKEIIESDSVHDIFENTETDGYVSEPHRVTDEEIVRAAKIARCYEFIDKMLEGIDTTTDRKSVV